MPFYWHSNWCLLTHLARKVSQKNHSQLRWHPQKRVSGNPWKEIPRGTMGAKKWGRLWGVPFDMEVAHGKYRLAEWFSFPQTFRPQNHLQSTPLVFPGCPRWYWGLDCVTNSPSLSPESRLVDWRAGISISSIEFTLSPEAILFVVQNSLFQPQFLSLNHWGLPLDHYHMHSNTSQ